MRNVLLAVVLFALFACGGHGAAPAGPPRVDFDHDPLVLVPGSAVALASVDARPPPDASAAGQPAGSPAASTVVGAIADWFVPLADDAAFQASRDVDRVLLAAYQTGGVELAAVFSGRFDAARIAAATRSRYGIPVARGTYAGFATYSVGSVTFAPLTAGTLVAGMGDGLRRVLERVRDGKLERSVPPWVAETVETKGAQVAVAADFASQPIAAATVGAIQLPWLEGVRVARILGNFAPPGVNVAGTVTYGNPQQAGAAADGIKVANGWLDRLGPLLGGIKLQGFTVSTSGSDVLCKFAVDDHSLGAALALAKRFLPTPTQ